MTDKDASRLAGRFQSGSQVDLHAHSTVVASLPGTEAADRRHTRIDAASYV